MAAKSSFSVLVALLLVATEVAFAAVPLPTPAPPTSPAPAPPKAPTPAPPTSVPAPSTKPPPAKPTTPAPPTSAPPKAPTPLPPSPPAPTLPPVKSRKDCIPLCAERCKLHSRQNVCARACFTCCDRCRCVPPGPYGNREMCGKCYTEMKTHGGRSKCP